MGITDHINEKINNFIELGEFDIYFREGKFINIGLKWGDGKRLKGLGIGTTEQKLFLNIMESEIKAFRMCPKCLKRDCEHIGELKNG